jgi:hypothetical protein
MSYYSAQYNCPWVKLWVVFLGLREITLNPREKMQFFLVVLLLQ